MPRHDHLLDSRDSEGGRLNRREMEASITDHQVWGMPKDLLMVGHGRQDLTVFPDASGQKAITRHDPAFDLVQDDMSAKFDRHARLAPLEDAGMWLKQADELLLV